MVPKNVFPYISVASAHPYNSQLTFSSSVSSGSTSFDSFPSTFSASGSEFDFFSASLDSSSFGFTAAGCDTEAPYFSTGSPREAG
eukprot:TRINITY_DN12392_c0_g1_i1.p2 TRINITY_DN12392_c0_g1~~TRINITY_DN12392_c0_g1_i1.p2  ORF type:complete len:85 (+),score=14.13 TRINITY_DN12392_c0_g1_i1:761-1015(+)